MSCAHLTRSRENEAILKTEKSTHDAGGALEGITVLEFAEGIAGPFTGMILAEWGANVLKVEPMSGDWSRTLGPPLIKGCSPTFLSVNRSKSSLPVNLHDERGRKLLKRIAARSDVIIEGYRPGVAEKLGVAYEDLKAVNERLIYCSISGFGDAGPQASRPGSDTILQGYSGLMSVTGDVDGPPNRVGTPIGDTSAGVYGALGIMAAMHQRHATGRGQFVSTSLLESLIGLQTVTFWDHMASGALPKRLGTRSSISAVPAEAFPTRDGHVMLSCHTPRQWNRLCHVLDHPEWVDDPRMVTNKDRVANHDEVVRLLTGVLQTRTTDEWLEVFESHSINAGPILTYPQVLADAQVEATGLFRRTEHERYGALTHIGVPVSLTEAAVSEYRSPPGLGEGGQVALEEHGLSRDEIRQYEKDGVVRLTGDQDQ